MEEQNVDNAPLFLTTAEKKKLQWQKERGGHAYSGSRVILLV